MRAPLMAGPIATLLAVLPAAALLGTPDARAAPACEAILYRDADFAGPRELVTDDRPYLRPDMDRQASSLRIVAGRWRFFGEVEYRGAALQYGPGAYPRVPPDWNDRIGSAQCAQAYGQGLAMSGDSALGATSNFPQTTPYVLNGQSYGWYDAGWNGAGFYVVGAQHVRGYGFGGRDGWRGWHRSYRYRFHDHLGSRERHGNGQRLSAGRQGGRIGGPNGSRDVHPPHFPGGQGGYRHGGHQHSGEGGHRGGRPSGGRENLHGGGHHGGGVHHGGGGRRR